MQANKTLALAQNFGTSLDSMVGVLQPLMQRMQQLQQLQQQEARSKAAECGETVSLAVLFAGAWRAAVHSGCPKAGGLLWTVGLWLAGGNGSHHDSLLSRLLSTQCVAHAGGEAPAG